MLLISPCFSLSNPHLIFNHMIKQNIRLAKFSMTPLIGHYRISQRGHTKTSSHFSCLVPFGSLYKCPSALCGSSKNSSIQVLFVKTFSLHLACLPQWLVLCRHSASPGLCCVSFFFFIIMQEMEDNSGTDVSPSEHREGFLPISSHL